MKKLFLMIATVAMLTACNGNGNNSGNASGSQNDSTSTEQADNASNGMQEGSKGPGTVECDNFTIDVPDSWEVSSKMDKELSVKAPSGEIFNFVYDNQSNYTQEKQFKMERDGMQDLGEKTFGDNTYATFLWKQDAGDVYSAIMKIGDGNSGTIKVNTTNVKTADNEMIAAIMGNIKMK